MPGEVIKKFLRLESASGILLMFAAVLAIIVANTPLQSFYQLLIDVPVEIRIGTFAIEKPLLLWINDGLMAVFFFLIGLELKREFIEGELSDTSQIGLPILGAIGGMAIPAMVYVYFNWDDPIALQGWAIPAATDIAFALGILLLLGSRVPTTVKVFLTTLAIFDDVGAIAIIAIFYTSKISFTALLVAGLSIILLFIINRMKVESKSVYLTIGLVMWVAMLKSGVHATLAGVILAIFIPMRSKSQPSFSPLKQLEHDLHTLVAFAILPIFAFANAGINLSGVGLEQLMHGVPLGITLGLFVGKQIGIFGLCWLGVKMGIARLPEGMSWLTLYGTSILCGVGFTMSLFIGSLAFEETTVNLLFDERLGIILGSLLSGVMGYIILRISLKPRDQVTAS
ncbi:Na+/H+ antiporter NhaA [Marinicella sp. W31]|uniref:Na+/H+ antiporter NhaA n=1 Tax=Marinicella sp. W31 TaxID=3023713 RepID=UPI003757478D